jgi:hypothetical protein
MESDDLISLSVIPGRLEEANPESRDSLVRNCVPEFDASHRAGMTGQLKQKRSVSKIAHFMHLHGLGDLA